MEEIASGMGIRPQGWMLGCIEKCGNLRGMKSILSRPADATGPWPLRRDSCVLSSNVAQGAFGSGVLVRYGSSSSNSSSALRRHEDLESACTGN